MTKEYPLCEYAFYAPTNKGTVLKCSKRNGLCIYSRYCGMLFKVIHTKGYENCTLRKNSEV